MPVNSASLMQMLQKFVKAVEETVAEAGPQGAPSTPIYLALSEKLGMSLETYTWFMNALCKAGKLEKRGDCYFIPTKMT